MNYSIHITATAERDMALAANYIEFVLKNPQAADHLLDEAERQINAVAHFPETFPLAKEPLLASWGIRFAKVNNYLAFYIISEERICIIRFLYIKSNWSAILKGDFSRG